MKLKLNPVITICNSEKLTEKSSFLVESSRTNGLYSDVLYIAIENEVDDDEDEAYVSIELNKNQALYLMQILSGFVKEKHIKIDDII